MEKQKLYWGRSILAFMVVLLTMPLGHALMRVMEQTMSFTAMNRCAFAMGAVGLALAVWGVFVNGDTRQTLFGLFGGLLFWTGWVEFLLGYYAARYGTQYDLVGSGTVQTLTEYVEGIGVRHQTLINGADIETIGHDELKALTGSRPEYLTMPGTFGFWAMMMVLYVFGTKTGCCGMNWLQKVFFGKRRKEIVPTSMSHHTSLTTFLELNVMMWTVYLLLMFLYDPVFFGDSHPVTLVVACICLVGAVFIFHKELRLKAWGPNLRMGIACVLVLWTAVEVFARNGLLKEFWVEPQEHVMEMVTMGVFFVALTVFLVVRSRRAAKRQAGD